MSHDCKSELRSRALYGTIAKVAEKVRILFHLLSCYLKEIYLIFLLDLQPVSDVFPVAKLLKSSDIHLFLMLNSVNSRPSGVVCRFFFLKCALSIGGND